MHNSQLTIHNSQFTFQTSEFIIQDPESKIQDPRSKIQDPRSKIQDPRSRSKNPESKRSPERLLDAKGGFDDQLSYPELTFGGRKLSFQCLVKSDGPKTCSYGFVRCFAAIWHIPNHFLSIEIYQNSSEIEFGKILEEIDKKC